MKHANENLKLYSISSAAKLMGICRDSVRAFLAKGDLGYISIGKRKKIAQNELVRFQKEGTIREAETVKDKIMTSKKLWNSFMIPIKEKRSYLIQNNF